MACAVKLEQDRRQGNAYRTSFVLESIPETTVVGACLQAIKMTPEQVRLQAGSYG